MQTKRRLATGAMLVALLSIIPLAGTVFNYSLARAQPVASQPTKMAPAASAPVKALAQVAPTSQPSDVPPVVNLDDPISIVRGVAWAWSHKAWPYLALLFLTVLLFVERQYKGVLGARSTAWLGSPKGIWITSIITGMVYGGLTAALSDWKTFDWKKLGAVALAALLSGLLNAGLQKGTGTPQQLAAAKPTG